MSATETVTVTADAAPTKGRRKDAKLMPAQEAAQAKAEAEEQRRKQIDEKLHPSLAAIAERLKKPDSKPTGEESKLVREGKAEVQIWLAEKTPEVLAQLKALGFEILLDPQSAKLVIGRVPIEKLSALAELKAVLYVAPQTR